MVEPVRLHRRFLAAALARASVYGRTNTMKRVSRSLVPAAIIAICVIAATAALADDGDVRENGPNRYLAASLTSDVLGAAPNTDPALRNAWGVAFTPGASPFWI